MHTNIQLLSITFSFIYGLIFFLITRFNFYILKDTSKYIETPVTFMLVINVAIIYCILMYHINNGYIHIYFIFSVIAGYIFSYILKIDKVVINLCKNYL